MRFVVPDTNFILHFKPISETSGAEIGVTDEFKWLVVGQVMQELDIRKGTGDKTLRKRARKAAREFEKAETGAAPFAGKNSLEVHFRTRDFDFEANGLLRNEGDHKVIADILDFRLDHPSDEVIFLSDDSSARMRARKYGIATIDAPEELQRPEIDDERDQQLRELKQAYGTLAETQPILDLAFFDDRREMQATVASFNQEEFEEMMGQVTAPEAEALDTLAPTEESAWFGFYAAAEAFQRPNPDYEEQLTKFREQFRDYFLVSWVEKYRTVEIAPVVSSRNGVQASGVNIRITAKTNAAVLSKLPKAAARPRKPRRTLSVFPTHSWDPSNMTRYSLGLQMPAFRPYSPSIRQAEESAVVTYGMMRLPQDDATVLDSFYLVFDHGVAPSNTIELLYEVRAQNMNGVARGRLLVRFEVPEGGMPAGYMLEVDS